MGIANLQTSTKIFAHGDPVNERTVRTRSLHTSTFIGFCFDPRYCRP